MGEVGEANYTIQTLLRPVDWKTDDGDTVDSAL